MRVVECPDEYVRVDGERSVFLGGGITNCPDWQQTMITHLLDVDNLALVNPRRASFDVNDPNATPFQIRWEYKHLRSVDSIMFWFTCETLCPITLFELAAAATRNDTIFVGCHPDYARRLDVVHQLSHIRPDVAVRDSLIDVEMDIRRWCLTK